MDPKHLIIMKTIQDVIKRFKTPRLGASVFQPIPHPYQLTPSDYIGFAEIELKDNDTKAAVSAVANIKLALECQIDELLQNWGYTKFLAKANYSYEDKLKLLSKLGLMAPLSLKQVIDYKKISENNYPELSFDFALAYFTVVNMFINYTDRILAIANEAEVLRDKADGDFVSIEIDKELAKITMRCFIHEGALPEQSISESRVLIGLSEKSFDDYNLAIKWWLRAIQG